jgi:hypothetical protein
VDPGPYLDLVTDDEALAGDLDEPDATALVKALTAVVRVAVTTAKTEAEAEAAVQALRKAGRAAARAVAAWRDDGPEAAAAAAKKAGLPAPPADADSAAAILAFYLGRLGT